MAREFDRNILTGLFETGLAISLGAAQKSIQMARNPPEAVTKVVSEMKSMLTVPKDAGPDLQGKAQAIASVWLQKGVTLVAECKAAGEKFTDGK
jgi:hypothetical protein